MTPENKRSFIVSRRDVLKAGGLFGAFGAAGPLLRNRLTRGLSPQVVTTGITTTTGVGNVPEQVHLTFGKDPATEVVVSWGSPWPQPRPRLAFGSLKDGIGTIVTPELATFIDGMNGQQVYYYHARLSGLSPDTAYRYEVRNGAKPESIVASTFTTAPSGRAPFRFTSFGDIATPNAAWTDSSLNAYFSALAVESFHPLVHLLNGDLSYANVNFTSQPEVWRDFGNNAQLSAANRPWMPCLGNHEIEFGSGEGFTNGPHGYGAYLTRYRLPGNGMTDLDGHFYSFQIGSVKFIALDGNDVVYEDNGALATSNLTDINGVTIPGGTSVFNQQYTGAFVSGPNDTLIAGANRQSLWLEKELKAARADSSVDWVIVQMHQDALSSSASKSDLGIRQAWVPLFDKYEVDLVIAGHSHDYERSFPVRGTDYNEGTLVGSSTIVNTNRPHVVNSDLSERTFDTKKGTVYLVLGGGGQSKPDNTYATEPNGEPEANVMVAESLPVENTKTLVWAKGVPQATEPAPWSAVRDPEDAWGIAVFDVDPGSIPGGRTSIKMRYYHAPSAAGGSTSYSLYDEVEFTKKRSDGLVTVQGKLAAISS